VRQRNGSLQSKTDGTYLKKNSPIFTDQGGRVFHHAEYDELISTGITYEISDGKDKQYFEKKKNKNRINCRIFFRFM
jgi:hypothetical protein